MKILVACEESQEVTKAFRQLGHEAYSCDISPCSGGHPEWHIQDDALPHLKRDWDMIIAFPPCTYLSRVTAPLLAKDYDKSRYKKGVLAKDFFMAILTADCEKIAVENPVPLRCFDLPRPSQIIEPWMFGHPYTKKTCLWLKGLPYLFATEIHQPKASFIRTVWGSKKRSKTFPGVAKAMAEQWG